MNGQLKRHSYPCSKCKANGISSIGAAAGKGEKLSLENGASVECVEELCNHGAMIMLTSDGDRRNVSCERQVCL